jgi:hypothetical protein
MTTISEGKYKALRRLERTFFPSWFLGVYLSRPKDEECAAMAKNLRAFCDEEFSKRSHRDSVASSMDDILVGVPRLFWRKEDHKLSRHQLLRELQKKRRTQIYNIKHHALAGLTLVDKLQDRYDLGLDDERVQGAILALDELFSEKQESWNHGNFYKSVVKKSVKVLNYLNDNELFIYGGVIYK